MDKEDLLIWYEKEEKGSWEDALFSAEHEAAGIRVVLKKDIQTSKIALQASASRPNSHGGVVRFTNVFIQNTRAAGTFSRDQMKKSRSERECTLQDTSIFPGRGFPSIHCLLTLQLLTVIAAGRPKVLTYWLGAYSRRSRKALAVAGRGGVGGTGWWW